MLSPGCRLHLPVEHLLGLLALGPGKVPLAETPLASQLGGLRPHLLEAAVGDWRVLLPVLFQGADGSLAPVR